MKRDYSRWHPDNIPVATVWARCSNPHHLQPLAQWVLMRTGRVPVWHAEGWRDEGVGAFTEGAYFRQLLECPRPSCNYRAEMAPVSGERVTQLLTALADATGWRVERDANKTPSHVIEMNDFLRDPEAEIQRVALRAK